MKSLIESFLAPDGRLPRWWAPLVAVALGLMAVWFWRGAIAHGDAINLEVTYNDQKVYINMAAALKDSGYTFSVPRMRMPLYGIVQSLFYKTGTTLAEYFPVGRAVNTGLSLVCTAVIALAFCPWLGRGLALMAALISGCTFFVTKAGYVQPEVMLCTLIGVTCAVLMDLLRRPVWWKAVLAGSLLCAWHMTKASGPAVLAVFIGTWTLRMIWPGEARRKALLACLALMVASFVLPMTTYVANNIKTFGSPFYNTQSKYYLWCEDVHEKHAIQKMHISWRPATAEELAILPSGKKYLARHSLSDIRKRVKKGYEFMMENVWEQHAELMAALTFCACLLLLAIGFYPRKFRELVRTQWWELPFVAGILLGFGLLYSWLQPIRVGPRMITSIHLVALFFTLKWIHQILRDETWKIRGVTLGAERCVIALLVPVLLLLAWTVMTTGLKGVYYGG
jgi:hypothetical protein